MTIQIPRRELDKNGNTTWVKPVETTADKRRRLQAQIADAQEKLTARFDGGAYCYTPEAREWAAQRLPGLQSELDALTD